MCEVFERDSERCNPGEGGGSVIIGGALAATHPCLNSLLPETPTPRRWEIGRESGSSRERTLKPRNFIRGKCSFAAFSQTQTLVKRRDSKQEQSVNAFAMLLQFLTFKICLPAPISDLLPAVKILTTGKYLSRFRTSVSSPPDFSHPFCSSQFLLEPIPRLLLSHSAYAACPKNHHCNIIWSPAVPNCDRNRELMINTEKWASNCIFCQEIPHI